MTTHWINCEKIKFCAITRILNMNFVSSSNCNFLSNRNFDILAAVFTEVLDYMHDDLGLIPSESIQSSDPIVNDE